MATRRFSCHHRQMENTAVTRILLLTGRDEVETLSQPLHAHNPSAEIVPMHDVAAVAAACTAAGAGTRLIAFCTSIIVPAAALAALPGPGYNFHPGPPSRPGRYPSVFALYDGDRRFGITVHEMHARVDSGPIVAADEEKEVTGRRLALVLTSPVDHQRNSPCPPGRWTDSNG